MAYMMRNGRRMRMLGDDVSSGGNVGAQIGGGGGGGGAFDFSVISDLFTGAPDASTDPSVGSTTNGTTVTSADFNCTKYPGICKPMNLPALAVVQSLQAQLNRVAQVKGLSKIQVDGAVGPASLALFNQVAAISSSTPYSMTQVGNVALLAADADVYASQTSGLATSLGAPAQVPAATLTAPVTLVNKTGTTLKAPQQNQDMAQAGIIAAFGGLPVVAQVGIVGLGVWGILKATKKKRR